MLEKRVRDRLEALTEEKADELNLEILELAIRPRTKSYNRSMATPRADFRKSSILNESLL